MKRLLFGAALLLACATAGAQEDEYFYAGGGGGRLHAKNACNGAIAGCEDSNGMGKGFGGYRFGRHFAAELAVSVATSFEIVGSSTTVRLWEASAIGLLPLPNERFALYGRLGAYHANVDVDAGLFSASQKKNSDGLMAGLGASVDFNRKLVGRVEWQRYQDVDFIARKSDTDVVSLSVLYRFR